MALCRAIFGDEREVRLRPHFFPFTEPSVEDSTSPASSAVAAGALAGPASADNLLQGAGLDRDPRRRHGRPNVLGFVAENGSRLQAGCRGFAFGLGVERVAMLRHGVPDLRRFFDNDVRMLEQFG